ncbi:melanin synthase [Aspergillus sergii]|uniref:Melanin synthase n=1 Tax=Aspergillus sergii TaxID=1034303 RepID=A0A5N6WKI7_9EURO|nr:melanin synthase [Aspergillus sergii]
MRQPNQSETPKLVLFGDQTANVSSLAKRLLLDAPQSVARSDFIRDASTTLRALANQLPPLDGEYLPRFDNVHDLATIYHESNSACHPAIASTLLAIVQLLQLFQYYETKPRRVEKHDEISVVGLCTGSLVAAAYAACASLDDLKDLAVPTVSIAFQMGLQAATASSMLHEQGTPLSSWSTAILKMTEDELLSALKMYHADGLLSLHQCFVSAVGLNSVTVSGPPPSLQCFTENLMRSGEKIRPLPIYSAYHASHIHSMLDFPSFLNRAGVDPQHLASFPTRKTLVCPSTGRPVDCPNALGLFKTVVLDTLQAPLRFDLVVDKYVAQIKVKNVTSITLDVVGPTTAAEGLASALRSRTQTTVSIRDIVALDLRKEQYQPSRPHNNAPLAIVGVSGRFPGAESAEELWNVLEAGLDMHRVIPTDRFDAEKHVDPSGKAKNTSWTPYGCFIDGPGEFDPRFFNMSPKEALQTDPMQRLALVTAYEALEMSGYVGNRTRSTTLSRIGTFYGQTSDDYRDVNAAQDIGTYFITGGIRAFGPGRINYYFKFEGPSFSVDTACSSSLAAIQLACTSLWSGDCDTAVTGGLSVLTSPDLFSGLSRGQFLSQTGSCKTFDKAADGYCRADGVGTVVIKRLKDAELDNDNVLAVILGAATNHSAQAVSITHPHAETQSKLYREILQQSGVDPFDVGYVEMHGTGTQAGDGTEMRSVTDVFAPACPSRPADYPLYVGAIKANIGHGEASSGVASLIKSILMFKKGFIPPHVGIKNEINKGFPDLEARNVRIAMTKTPLPAPRGSKRTILVNNFSAAGGNTALLIQEPPKPVTREEEDPRPSHAVTVSGHTATAFKNNLEKLIAYISNNPDISPGDLSYTTTARRKHYGFRCTVVEPPERILVALQNKRGLTPSNSLLSHGKKSVIFVFTGQGAIYPALAHELYASSTQFRTDILLFDGIARQQGYPSFLSLVDGSVSDISQLSAIQTQVGLVSIQIALSRLWRSWGIKPTAVVGHSLGEYAALQVSGVLSVSDAIFLVGYRARLLESRCRPYTHSMLAVSEVFVALQPLLATFSGDVEIACSNSPRETVFAGKREVIDDLEVHLSCAKIRCTKLQVPFAFHTAQVDPIIDDLEEFAKGINFGTPQIPILSASAGRPLGVNDQIDAAYIRKHCRETVQFASAVQRSSDQGLLDESVFIEIGPHPICLGMIRDILGDKNIRVPTLRRKESPWKVIVSSLASLHDQGFSINWSEYHRDFDQTHRLLNLPSYAFDNKKYWMDYRNDWTLRKGDALPVIDAVRNKVREPAKKLSSSVHRVVSEDYDASDPVVIFETELWDPKLHAAVSGHRVNGSALCPSSIYADIAQTVAHHIQQQENSGINLPGLNITSMEVVQPLIIKAPRKDENRILRLIAHIDRASQRVRLEYTTATSEEKTTTKHANCIVEYGSPEKWLRRWSHSLHLVQERIDGLETKAALGEVSKVTSNLAYRLFSSLVDYAPEYQRMSHVLLASSLYEAAAKVSLDVRGDDTSFQCSPYWIDSLAHLSGFVMNGNENINYKEAVYISHGWESMRFARPLVAGGQYQTYVRMLPVDKTMFAGDVWILHEGEIIGLIEDLRFQRVPRAVLDVLLPPIGANHKPVPVKKKAPKEAPQPAFSKPQAPITTVNKAVRRVGQKEKQSTGSILGLVEEELGLSSKLYPDDNLSEIGLDSLMALTVAGRLRDEFDIDISHSQLLGCSTVEQLLDVLNREHRVSNAAANDTVISDHLIDHATPYSLSPSLGSSSTEPVTPEDTADDTVYLVRSVILEETGLTEDNLEPTADLASLGIDSLMSLTVLGRLREEGVELPMDFFLQNTTMNEVSKALVGSNNSLQPEAIAAAYDRKGPQANAILLQRRSNLTSNQKLFLFPDGSGSPASYAGLEGLHPNFDVYGLVCPFRNNPDGYTDGIEEVVRTYLSTIRNHSPSGPYHLGGWSVGGVLAYEATKQLIEAGEEIHNLILIDAPCPTVLPPMSSSLIKYLNSIGILGQMQNDDSKLPHAVSRCILDHFDATIKNLGVYDPTRSQLSAALAPRTSIIWAREGVCDGLSDLRLKANPSLAVDATASWILDKRNDFGSGGWETLLPARSISSSSVPGNHFTMMQPSNIGELSKQLQLILSSSGL